MNACKTSSILALGFCLIAACSGKKEEQIRFEYTAAEPVICAETDIGFHPRSSELTRAAENILYDTVDQMGGDCEEATITITAWRDDSGDEMAGQRLEAIQTAIHASYGLPYSMMTTAMADPPSPSHAGRVGVALMIQDTSGEAR